MNKWWARVAISAIILTSSVLQGAADDVPPSQPKAVAVQETQQPATEPAVSKADDEVAGTVLEGYASYYAKRFIGRKTSSGQRYHPDKLTAAHYSLPLGTEVRVVNPVTGQFVDVTINDRCAWKRYHFIDLSREAAKRIGLWGKGKIRVQIIVPDDEEEQ